MTATAEKIFRAVLFIGFFLILTVIPLLVSADFYFPFVFPKAIVFRLLVDVLLAVFLVLAVFFPKYRIRITPLIGLYGIFLVWAFIASAVGENFYLSFWGDMERSEGLIMHLHFFAFLLLITSVVRTRQEWQRLLFFSLGSAILMGGYAIGQKLGLSFFVNTQGTRLSSTIGNPAFFASVLIFNIFFALSLLLTTRKPAWSWLWAAVISFFVYLIYETGTRGSVLGLLLALVCASAFVFTSVKNKRLRWGFSLGLLLVIASAGLVRWQAQSPWVQQSNALYRLANLSFQSQTVQTRFMTWEISLRGMREHPVFGVGMENFNVVFDKHFNSKFYQDEGSVVWFDRAHNLIFDRGVTTGIVGLLLYLSLLGFAIFQLLQIYRRVPEHRGTAASLLLLFVAYIFHMLFVFDVVVSYILLMLVLGYISYLAEGQAWNKMISTRLPYQIGLAAWLVALLPVVYLGSVKPALASHDTAQSLSAQAYAQTLTTDEALPYHETAKQEFLQALHRNTYANQEIRVQFAQFIDTLIANNYSNTPFLEQAIVEVNQELEEQILEDPKNVASYLLAMRHYNYSEILSNDYPRRVIDLFDQAVPLSPGRVHLYVEAGYAHVHQAQHYEKINEAALAAEQYAKAETRMRYAIELNPEVAESYINLILVYYSSSQDEKAEAVLGEMDRRSVKYHVYPHLRKLANLAVGYKKYAQANKFLQEIHNQDPLDLRSAIDLALSFAYMGQSEKAIEIAEQVRLQFPGNVQDVDSFIERVRSGYYQPSSP